MSGINSSLDEIKVSVAMTTYNHEEFIAQAIESVLMQQTDFEYELIIGEDCSTDQTRNIVQEYAEKHPNLIKTLLHPHNLGPAHSPGKHNFVSVLEACQGDYIAILEGDDYWIDPYKLQKQVEFLEANEDYVLVCANALRTSDQNEFTTARLKHIQLGEFDFSIRDLFLRNPVITLTVMFRNYLIKKFPEIFFVSYHGDWPLYMLLCQYGKGHFMNQVFGVYRSHNHSVISQYTGQRGIVELYEHLMNMTDKWDEYFDYQYHDQVEKYKEKRSREIAEIAVRELWFDRVLLHVGKTDLNKITSTRVKLCLAFFRFLSIFLPL